MNIHTDNPIAALESEAKYLGINIGALCDKAEVDRSTFTRGKSGSDTRSSTIRKLRIALDELSTTIDIESLTKINQTRS